MGTFFQIELEFENLGIEERGTPEYPEKTPSEQGREPTTNSNLSRLVEGRDGAVVRTLTFQVRLDDANFCYCAYVLRILRYSGFLWVLPTNTGIFLRGLKLCGESTT